MKYNGILIYMNADDFEEMINVICQNILGFGTISFTKGRDGGKDGRFHGRANKFPSESNPWEGKIVIQAKHTSLPTGICTSGEFFTNTSSVINKEITKIKEIKRKEGLDYYLLFTNRKYTGGSDCQILNKISNETKIPKSNINIIGVETLNTLLNSNRSIPRNFDLHKYHIPFDFSDDEIKELINNFHKKLPEYENQIGNEVELIKKDFAKILDPEKNIKNDLGKEYYETVILSESLPYFDKIEVFLYDPVNSELKDVYYDIVSELRDLIVIKRNDFSAFEEIFVFIYNLICSGDSTLRGKKRFVNIFLHYMYHTCSIGLK